MHIQAWYPLGHGDKALINEPVFTRLAEKYGKSNVQIILRWHIQSGDIVHPRFQNPGAHSLHADIFGFTLTESEMAEIAALDSGKRYYESTPEKLASYAAIVPDVDGQK